MTENCFICGKKTMYYRRKDGKMVIDVWWTGRGYYVDVCSDCSKKIMLIPVEERKKKNYLELRKKLRGGK